LTEVYFGFQLVELEFDVGLEVNVIGLQLGVDVLSRDVTVTLDDSLLPEVLTQLLLPQFLEVLGPVLLEVVCVQQVGVTFGFGLHRGPGRFVGDVRFPA